MTVHRRPSRQLVIFEIARNTFQSIVSGGGRPGDLVEAATTARHTVATFVIQEDGTPAFERWDDQRLRPEEFGLFRALVAEMRLEGTTLPAMEIMMERARARLSLGRST